MLDMLNDYPDLLSVPEVPALLWVDTSCVYRLTHAGHLPAFRPAPPETGEVKADPRRCLEAARKVTAAPPGRSMHGTGSRTWRDHDA